MLLLLFLWLFFVFNKLKYKIRLSDYNWTRTQNHLARKRTFIWPNGQVFVYELSGSRFESSCSYLNFRFRACFEQAVPWHSGNYRVWIHWETRTWHDQNIQSYEIRNTVLIFVLILKLRHQTKWFLDFQISQTLKFKF